MEADVQTKVTTKLTKVTATEMLFGAPLAIPGLCVTSPQVDPSPCFVRDLVGHPPGDLPPVNWHSPGALYFPPALNEAEYVFVKSQNAMQCSAPNTCPIPSGNAQAGRQ